MPANGFDRRTPSLTAQDRAERRTSQREDTVDTDCPADCHRQIAAGTSLGVRDTRRRRPSESSTRARTTCLCERHGGGLPQVWSGEEPLQQLRNGAADAEVVDQLPPSLLGCLFVPVNRERALDTSRMNRVEADDHPDLPHAWESLADGARASLRSVDRYRHIRLFAMRRGVAFSR
jgi:hypothetical protein